MQPTIYDCGNGHSLRNFGAINVDLFRCEQPGVECWKPLAERDFMRTVINLRGDGEDHEERQALMRLGYFLEETPEQISKRDQVDRHYIPLPLPGLHAGAPNIVNEIVSLVEDPKLRPLLFHCRRGADRTGTIGAIYRLDNGWTYEEAMQEAFDFGMSDLQVFMQAFIAGYATGTI